MRTLERSLTLILLVVVMIAIAVFLAVGGVPYYWIANP